MIVMSNNESASSKCSPGLRGSSVRSGGIDFVQKERIRNAEAKRARLASEASDYAIQKMVGAIDWGRFSYETRNTCTGCNGQLKLISKCKDKQRFICKSCGTKYELINHANGSPKAWDLAAKVMTVQSNVPQKGTIMPISAF